MVQTIYDIVKVHGSEIQIIQIVHQNVVTNFEFIPRLRISADKTIKKQTEQLVPRIEKVKVNDIFVVKSVLIA